jgi:enolase
MMRIQSLQIVNNGKELQLPYIQIIFDNNLSITTPIYNNQHINTNSIDLIESILINQELDAVQLDTAIFTQLAPTPPTMPITFAISSCLYKAQALQEDMELYELFCYVIGQETVMLPLPLIPLITQEQLPLTIPRLNQLLIIPLSGRSLQDALIQSTIFAQYYYQQPAHYTNQHALLLSVGTHISKYQEQHNQQYSIVLGLNGNASHTTQEQIDTNNPDQLLTSAQLASPELVSPELVSPELVLAYQEYQQLAPISHLIDPFASIDITGWQSLAGITNTTLELMSSDFSILLHPHKPKVLEYLNGFYFKPSMFSSITQLLQTIMVAHNDDKTIILQGLDNEPLLADIAIGSSSTFLVTNPTSTLAERLMTIEKNLTQAT